MRVTSATIIINYPREFVTWTIKVNRESLLFRSAIIEVANIDAFPTRFVSREEQLRGA